MSHKGELQTLVKLSMRHQVCPSETCRTIISESIITMLMSGGRSDIYKYSYFPRTGRCWNLLPAAVVCVHSEEQYNYGQRLVIVSAIRDRCSV